MDNTVKCAGTNRQPGGVMSRLAQDTAGNTIALIAASIFPLLAMIGGGIDMGRTYLTHTRLQQACDAGVLAARKKLGSTVAATMPADVETAGNKFFDLNFGAGAYGTENRNFTQTLEIDQAISGTASVDVPTTIMQVFGNDKVSVTVSCQSRLNFSNTDVMFVLDTTGSMAATNPGDTKPKIEVMKDVVRNFYGSLQSNKPVGTRMRFGFVPYSTNVNVVNLLKSDWMVDKWTYQSRVPEATGSRTVSFFSVTYERLSGSHEWIPPYPSPTCPANTFFQTYGPTTVVSTDPYEDYYDSKTNGSIYSCQPNDGGYLVAEDKYDNLIERTHNKWAYEAVQYDFTFLYKPVTYDVTKIKGTSGSDTAHQDGVPVQIEADPSTGKPANTLEWNTGCIEERDTYEINDYNNVDLTRALDLDIDLVPTAGDARTQWRPMLPGIEFERLTYQTSGGYGFTGTFSPDPAYADPYITRASWAGVAACPAGASKLAEMDQASFDSYLDTLRPLGDTYHDIGMIWGGRLLSPTGIFADENADVPGKPTNRHLIFLTDGKTEAFKEDYASYGVEPLDQRRWSQTSTLTLNQVVEKRFGVACNEVKKRNISVWVIGFGTTLNPIMKECAGPGHYFEANNAAELSTTFSRIAQQLGDLRITK